MSNPISESIVIEFGGIRFRRYPNSRHAHLRNYFWPNASAKRRGIGALHVEVYKAHHGPIPKSLEVHHKDGNPLNNDPGNLELLTRKEHIHRHFTETTRLERAQIHIATIRPLAAAWHSTAEGHEFHKSIGKAAWASETAAPHRQLICQHCGAPFVTRHRAEAKFCSSKCRQAARRAAQTDHEDRSCVICGNRFRVNRHEQTRCCSRKCAWQLRRQVSPGS